MLLKPLENLPLLFKMKKKLKIKSLRSDHGGAFQNEYFENFCVEFGISHNFSTLGTH